MTCRAMAVLLSSFLVVGQGSGLVFQAAAAAVEGACRGAGPPVGSRSVCATLARSPVPASSIPAATLCLQVSDRRGL